MRPVPRGTGNPERLGASGGRIQFVGHPSILIERTQGCLGRCSSTTYSPAGGRRTWISTSCGGGGDFPERRQDRILCVRIHGASEGETKVETPTLDLVAGHPGDAGRAVPAHTTPGLFVSDESTLHVPLLGLPLERPSSHARIALIWAC